MWARPAPSIRFLDVPKQVEAVCFHDLAGTNATEDSINKTHAFNNCAGKLAITSPLAV